MTKQRKMLDYNKLEKILQCPITKEDLKYYENIADANLDDKLFGEINVEKGFVNVSNSVFYPIKSDIIIMLPEYAITSLEYTTNIDVLTVKSFYDGFGWKKNEEGKYNDNKLFVNQENASDDYMEFSSKRVNQFLNEKGDYILDIASGPVYQSEYKEFSQSFKNRICIDVSITALEEAQENLKEQNAIFILGDITNIPLKPESCDNVISMHTLYHVPKNKQIEGVNELVRVCKSNSNVVIAYNWGWHSTLMNLALFPSRFFRLFRRLKKIIPNKNRKKGDKTLSELYFYSHSRRFFNKNKSPNTQIRYSVLRSLHMNFISLYLSNNDRSKRILDRIFKLEDKHATFFGKHGAFPLIILEKTDANKK
jgi:ubiquinone/menaquinone biosynthesis C-methylase UbiE/uncharacterized protein YbaR (Trm112 family)